jgi:hypothetical protein
MNTALVSKKNTPGASSTNKFIASTYLACDAARSETTYAPASSISAL